MITVNIQSKIPQNSTLIVGLSGGPDSVCLLMLLSKLSSTHNLKLIAAHLDHQWRTQSAQDALWCKKLCETLPNITYVQSTAAELKIEPKYNGSKEAIGRTLRRTFFQQLAQKYRADHIVLAHHADDQKETFFIRLIRGAGITGLAGIQESDGLYLRPLLQTTKQEILDYLQQRNIDFLIDESNQDLTFLRNKIRHQLIPLLAQIDSRIHANVLQTMDHLQKTDDFLQQQTVQILQTLYDADHDLNINLERFLQQHEIIQYRIILHLLITHKIGCTPSIALFTEIMKFLQMGKQSTHQIHQTGMIVKQKNHFSFKSL